MPKIDHDSIELSNLNRQILYGEADLGRPKAAVAAEWLRRFDAAIEVCTVQPCSSSTLRLSAALI